MEMFAWAPLAVAADDVHTRVTREHDRLVRAQVTGRIRTASLTYRQFAEAMAARKQIVCEYDGYIREVAPSSSVTPAAKRKH